MPGDIEGPKKKGIWKWLLLFLPGAVLVVAVLFLIRLIFGALRRYRLKKDKDPAENPQGEIPQPPDDAEDLQED